LRDPHPTPALPSRSYRSPARPISPPAGRLQDPYILVHHYSRMRRSRVTRRIQVCGSLYTPRDTLPLCP